MTKKEAYAEFKEYVLWGIKKTYESDGKIDKPARCEAWNNFTDMLCKEGRISLKQYQSWTNPF